ncbi:MAG: hypothetical protein BVN32_13865 [Proteobacteria bacterium ST_bin14]|nr:MAG: hypothetical protein BVN32_13865 [Proteobacteria bacterium ST_bin14]
MLDVDAKARLLAKVTHSNQLGEGAGHDRNPGDSSAPPELSLAVLECEEGALEAHLAALTTLVHGAAGSIHVTEITSTCLAIGIDAPLAAQMRLQAALKLGGATVVPCAANDYQVYVILAVRPPYVKDPQICQSSPELPGP